MEIKSSFRTIAQTYSLQRNRPQDISIHPLFYKLTALRSFCVLFAFCLPNQLASSSSYIATNGGAVSEEELEKIREEAIVS
jgi:hypothetical protein